MIKKTKKGFRKLKKNKIAFGFVLGLLVLGVYFFLREWGGGTLIIVFTIISIREVHRGLREAAKTNKKVNLRRDTTLGIISISVPMLFAFIMMIKFSVDWLMFMAFNNYMTDVGAYLFGSYAKKREWDVKPLAPVVSPNKTWEGAIAGILLSFIICLIVQNRLINPEIIRIDVYSLAILIFLGSVFNILGDLAGSMFKRAVDIKDSGETFGSHGGFLDKADGFIACSVGYTLFLTIVTLVKLNLPLNLSLF